MTTEILKYFEYEHLPERLQRVSREFHYIAHWIDGHIHNCEEKDVALRKLLESKDAAVRANI